MTGTPYFLPIADRAVPFQFGVDAARDVDTEVLIPEAAFAIDGLIWGNVPLEDRKVQMPTRCKNGGARHEKYICWISNNWTWDAPEGDVRRDNIASISTPKNYDPASLPMLEGYDNYKATDGIATTHWVSSSPNDQIFWIPDLHPVSIELIVLDWYLGAAGSYFGTYASAYKIEIDVAESPSVTDWETIYETTSGNGGDNDVLTLADDFSGFGYNGELAYQIRFSLTERGNTGEDYYYGVADFEVYGTVGDQLFLRKEDPNDPGSSEVWWEMWIKNHPGHLWFISNEPDNFDLDNGDGLTPAEYGAFYATLATLIRSHDPSAQLIFCQGTRGDWVTVSATPTVGTPPPTPTPGPSPTPPGGPAPYHPYGGGPGYCDLALAEAKIALAALNTANGWDYTIGEIIDGFSTHEYIAAKIDDQGDRETQIANWQGNLQEFTDWVNELTDDLLDGRPLYLTEYGDFANACAEVPGAGTPTPTALAPGCGPIEEDYAWYGANSEEGYWAIQFYTDNYFLHPCLNASQTSCNAQWVTAWWFLVGRDAGLADIGGLIGDEFSDLNINRSGEHYRDAIDCHLSGQNCPPTATPTP